MKVATVQEIKKELEKKERKELLSYCLRLVKFKKENKELLDFLLFQSGDLPGYIENVKAETEELFAAINYSNIFFIKKSVRKILRMLNKQNRFILSKQAEAETLIHFCNCIVKYPLPLKKSRQLQNLYNTQLAKIDAVLLTLHPDLQYDLRRQLNR
jgi:hypothetical protein